MHVRVSRTCPRKKMEIWGFQGVGFVIFIASSILPIITLSVSSILPHLFFHHVTSSHSLHFNHFSSIITFLTSSAFHLASFVFNHFAPSSFVGSHHFSILCFTIGWFSQFFSFIGSMGCDFTVVIGFRIYG